MLFRQRHVSGAAWLAAFVLIFQVLAPGLALALVRPSQPAPTVICTTTGQIQARAQESSEPTGEHGLVTSLADCEACLLHSAGWALPPRGWSLPGRVEGQHGDVASWPSAPAITHWPSALPRAP